MSLLRPDDIRHLEQRRRCDDGASATNTYRGELISRAVSGNPQFGLVLGNLYTSKGIAGS